MSAGEKKKKESKPLAISVRWLYVADTVIGVIFALLGYTLRSVVVLGLPSLLTVVFMGFGLGVALASAVYTRENYSIFIAPPVRKKPKAEKVKKDTINNFVHAHKRLDELTKRRSKEIEPRILEAGMTLSPYKFMSTYTFALLVSFVSVPIGVALAYIISPYLALLALLPLPVYLLPNLVIASNKGDRKRHIEDELPFFVAYASVMQSVGVNLYSSFVRIISRGVFANLEKEALLLRRNVEFFFKAPSEALAELGRLHPNQSLKGLLYGYTAQWLSGGDIAHYLELKSDDFLKELQYRWQKYTNSASDMGEMLVSLFFVLPVLILTSAMITSDANMLGIMVIAIIPLIVVLGIVMVSNAQPKTYDKLDSNYIYAIIAGAVVFAAVFVITRNYLAIASGVIAASVVYGMPIMEQQREINKIEGALPQFMRDMTEYKKLGYDLVGAIIKIANENDYNTIFNAYIRHVAARLKMGLSLKESIMKTRSWLTNTSFFLLSELAESGGGTPAILENITNFVVSVNRVKAETKSSMRIYEFLTYFTPVGLAFVAGLMVTVMTSLMSGNMFGGAGGLVGLGTGGIALGQITPATTNLVNYLIIMVAVGMSIVAGKAIDFTVKSTVRVAVVTIIAVVSILVVGSFAHTLVNSFNLLALVLRL